MPFKLCLKRVVNRQKHRHQCSANKVSNCKTLCKRIIAAQQFKPPEEKYDRHASLRLYFLSRLTQSLFDLIWSTLETGHFAGKTNRAEILIGPHTVVECMRSVVVVKNIKCCINSPNGRKGKNNTIKNS